MPPARRSSATSPRIPRVPYGNPRRPVPQRRSTGRSTEAESPAPSTQGSTVSKSDADENHADSSGSSPGAPDPSESATGFPLEADYIRFRDFKMPPVSVSQRNRFKFKPLRSLVSQLDYDSAVDVLRHSSATSGQLTNFAAGVVDYYVLKKHGMQHDRVNIEKMAGVVEGGFVMYSKADNKPMVAPDNLFDAFMFSHHHSGHSGRDKSFRVFRKYFANCVKNLMGLFLHLCPTCANKINTFTNEDDAAAHWLTVGRRLTAASYISSTLTVPLSEASAANQDQSTRLNARHRAAFAAAAIPSSSLVPLDAALSATSPGGTPATSLPTDTISSTAPLANLCIGQAAKGLTSLANLKDFPHVIAARERSSTEQGHSSTHEVRFGDVAASQPRAPHPLLLKRAHTFCAPSGTAALRSEELNEAFRQAASERQREQQALEMVHNRDSSYQQYDGASSFPLAPPNTISSFGPSYGVVFGNVVGGAGNLFQKAGDESVDTVMPRTVYGAPDLGVYLGPGYGIPGLSGRPPFEELWSHSGHSNDIPPLDALRRHSATVVSDGTFESIAGRKTRKVTGNFSAVSPVTRAHSFSGKVYNGCPAADEAAAEYAPLDESPQPGDVFHEHRRSVVSSDASSEYACFSDGWGGSLPLLSSCQPSASQDIDEADPHGVTTNASSGTYPRKDLFSVELDAVQQPFYPIPASQSSTDSMAATSASMLRLMSLVSPSSADPMAMPSTTRGIGHNHNRAHQQEADADQGDVTMSGYVCPCIGVEEPPTPPTDGQDAAEESDGGFN